MKTFMLTEKNLIFQEIITGKIAFLTRDRNATFAL
jgi:hypothetical protein